MVFIQNFEKAKNLCADLLEVKKRKVKLDPQKRNVRAFVAQQ